MLAPDSKAKLFLESGNKEYYVNMIMLAHFLAIFFHFMSEILIKYEKKILAGWFMIFKIFSYILFHFILQTGIIFEDCRDGIIDES
jgi:hypothetical protein